MSAIGTIQRIEEIKTKKGNVGFLAYARIGTNLATFGEVSAFANTSDKWKKGDKVIAQKGDDGYYSFIPFDTDIKVDLDSNKQAQTLMDSWI